MHKQLAGGLVTYIRSYGLSESGNTTELCGRKFYVEAMEEHGERPLVLIRNVLASHSQCFLGSVDGE